MKLVSQCFLEQCEHTLDQILSAQNVLSQVYKWASFIPRLSGMRNVHVWRAWYIFSRDHYVIKIGPEFLEQKGNILRVIQPTLHPTLGIYNIRLLIAIYVQ